MKDYRGIIFKYFKKEKKRTMLTIFGIILSVAMITSVFTIMDSMRKVMIKEATHENGSYYGELKNVDSKTIEKLTKHVSVEEVGVYRDLGYGLISDITKKDNDFEEGIPEHRYINVMEETETNFDLWKFKLKEGRFPENNREIILEENALKVLGDGYKIGSEVSFDMVDNIKYRNEDKAIRQLGNENYKLVGIMESGIRRPYNYLTTGFTKLEKIESDREYNTMFKTDKILGASDKIMEIGRGLKVPEENIDTNYKLLRLSAESTNKTFNNSMVQMVSIIVLIIIVATIAVIYNSFNISVIERISEFGTLRAIGMKKSQLLNLVLLEALILVLIALPLGLISGFLAMHIVFTIVGNVGSEIYFINNLTVEPNLQIIVFVVVLSVITVLLSAVIPAIKASKVSVISAIRNSGEIKLEKIKKAKKSSLFSKVFGIEGEIAYKNLTRNRSRFLITVFSMTISMILLITFSSFTENIYKITDIEKQSAGEFVIMGNESIGNTEKLRDEILELNGIDKLYMQTELDILSIVEKDKVKDKYLEHFMRNIRENEGKLEIQSSINYIGDEKLENLSKVKISDMDKENGVIVFNNTKILTENKVEDKVKGYNFKTGDKIRIMLGDNSFEEVKVLGVIEDGIEGLDRKFNGRLMLFTSSNNIEKFSDGYLRQTIKISTDENSYREEILEKLDDIETDYNFTYMDMEKMIKEENVMKIVTNIFLYGFISLIALISSINIINTISTNIIIRTREIAILKAIGMRSKDIKKMIALEGIYYSFYSIFFGVLVSLPLSYLLYKSMVGISLFSYNIPITGILIGSFGTFVISLISGIYPLKKINEKIIIENIRN